MSSRSIEKKMTLPHYAPNLGYIGRSQVAVPNYLFATAGGVHEYSHSKSIITLLKHRSVKTELKNSKLLSENMFRNGLSFSKHLGAIDKEFSVSCTPIVIPIPVSTFTRLEEAAAKLIMALRLIMQDIYGSEKPEDARYIRSLPQKQQEYFLSNIKNSPHYIPQLHHRNMANYPFFDVVGLDLVLISDLEVSPEDESHFPFRLLEINAGSPSGASNNQHLLELLAQIDPQMIKSAGNILPNNHFETMASTYRALGREWTHRDDGLAVILAPGGQSGAAPEIHELARRSGVLYCEASDFFLDRCGYLRVRDIHGDNPLVTAIYSRVNADAALFSREKGILLRDFESGETLCAHDPLARSKQAKLPRAKTPLQSIHAIPGLLDAVLNHRVYLGGLNRLLDDKCLLQNLCVHGPTFFAHELKAAELDADSKNQLLPPVSPVTPQASVAAVQKNPIDWVIKAPHLSGGSGVHILRCLTSRQRKTVVRNFVKSPKNFALQHLVAMGRIPSPIQNGNQRRYANLAADLRMWVFYGAGKDHARPILTRNALMRTAPSEKGAMSSIVNTSKGGGYAPVAVIDTHAVGEAAFQLDNSVRTKAAPSIVPLMTAAKIVQTARICKELKSTLEHDRDCGKILFLSDALRTEVREISSFLSPDAIGHVQDIHLWQIRSFERIRAKSTAKKRKFSKRSPADWLITHKSQITKPMLNALDRLDIEETGPSQNGDGQKAIPKASARDALTMLGNFEDETRRHLDTAPSTQSLAKLFARKNWTNRFHYQATIPEADFAASSIATLWEFRTGKRLVDSNQVPQNLRDARSAWLQIEKKAKNLPPMQRSLFFEKMRSAHFDQHPSLRELQRLLDKTSTDNVEELSCALQLTPYSSFGLRSYALRHEVPELKILAQTVEPARLSEQNSNIEEKLFKGQPFLGETTLKKTFLHERVSHSSISIWVSTQQSPFCAANTLGHELIHVVQFEELQQLERDSLHRSPLDAAIFANFYATLFEVDSASAAMEDANRVVGRQHIFGISALSATRKKWLESMLGSAKKGAVQWNKQLAEMGNWISYDTIPRNSDRVKACREVLASLENAKNIRFVKSLGLHCTLDEISAATPFADNRYRQIYEQTIRSAIDSTSLNWNALRVLANAQLPGVRFHQTKRPRNWSIINATLGAITLDGVATQSQ